MENTIENAEHFVTFYEDQDGNHFVGNRLFVARMLREYGKQLTVSNYAATIRPAADVVVRVPSEMETDDLWGIDLGDADGFNRCLSELRSLNPTLTFSDDQI